MRAGSAISGAADTMLSAAGTLSDALYRHTQLQGEQVSNLGAGLEVVNQTMNKHIESLDALTAVIRAMTEQVTKLNTAIEEARKIVDAQHGGPA